MMTAVATINLLLIALSTISVWGAYQATTGIVAMEAACTTEFACNLSAFSYPGTTATRSELVTYLQHAVRDEWPSMQQHAYPDTNTEITFDIMFVTVNHITSRDDHERVLLVEVLARVDEMVKCREKRLRNLEATMSDTLWGVMLIVSNLSLLSLYALPATRLHMALAAVWATMLGLVFFFVLAMDRPFAGEVSVSAAPFECATQTLSDNRPRAHPGLG